MVRLKPVHYTPALAITGAIRGTCKAKLLGNKGPSQSRSFKCS